MSFLGDSRIKGSGKKHKMTNCIFRDFRFPFYVVFLPANSVLMLYIHQKVVLLHIYTVSHSSVIQFEISLAKGNVSFCHHLASVVRLFLSPDTSSKGTIEMGFVRLCAWFPDDNLGTNSQIETRFGM